MLNLPGNSGKFFGGDINFYINDNFITFTQGDLGVAVRGTDPIKYLNSPYYPAIRGKTVPFVKPPPRFVGEYEFTGLDVDFVKRMLLGDDLELFEKQIGTSYFETGKIENTKFAIDWWNSGKIKNIRLQTVLYNFILEHDFKNISKFKNRHLEIIQPPKPVPEYELNPPVDCKCTIPVTRFKTIFGILWPLARKQIHKGFIYSHNQRGYELNRSAVFRCVCNRHIYHHWHIEVVDYDIVESYPVFKYYLKPEIETFKKHNRIYEFNVPLFRPEFPVCEKGELLRLVEPEKKIIPGVPWDITAPFNYTLNERDCHLEVLKARGGDFFKADLEKFKEKKSMKLEWDVNALLDFIYSRKADIKFPKKELALAKYVMNTDYQNYILNYLIDNDLYLYYKLN